MDFKIIFQKEKYSIINYSEIMISKMRKIKIYEVPRTQKKHSSKMKKKSKNEETYETLFESEDNKKIKNYSPDEKKLKNERNTKQNFSNVFFKEVSQH